MTEIKSFKFRGKEIKYYNYDFPTHSSQYYMESELEFIEKYLSLDSLDVFIDVGCAYGSWSLPALSLGALVVAVDPSPIFTTSIYNNINLNGWKEKCMVIQGAVTERENDWISYNFISGSIYKTQGLDIDRNIPVEQPLITKTITLDSFNPYINGRINLIKIDVEGAEKRVLMGAGSLLKKHRPKIILEHHEDLSGRIKDIIPENYIEKNIDGRWFLSPK